MIEVPKFVEDPGYTHNTKLRVPYTFVSQVAGADGTKPAPKARPKPPKEMSRMACRNNTFWEGLHVTII